MWFDRARYINIFKICLWSRYTIWCKNKKYSKADYERHFKIATQYIEAKDIET
mgnify:CR=1 FL=1